jgi:hypothetical protein
MTDTSTTTWTANELARFGGADEIGVSTRRRDGWLRTFVPIWVVTVDGVLYVRSYRGTGGAWYRHATTHPDGAIEANGLQVAVTFTRADGALRDDVDAAYRTKYARYGGSYLTTMLGEQAVASTLKLTPQCVAEQVFDDWARPIQQSEGHQT